VGAQGCGTHVAWVQIGVIGEDDIISRHRFAIGEFHAAAQGGSVLGGVGGFIILNIGISSTLIEVFCTIVDSSFTFNGILDDTAGAISRQKADLGHGSNICIVGS